MEQKNPQKHNYAMKQDELRKIAKDFVDNNLFLTNDPEIMARHFLVLTFMNPEDMPSDLAAVCEYYSEAGPMALNGLPIFMSCRLIIKKDFIQLLELIEQYKEMLKGWV